MTERALRDAYGRELAGVLSKRWQHLRVVDRLGDIAMLAGPCVPLTNHASEIGLPAGDDHVLVLEVPAGEDWREARAATVHEVRNIRGSQA